MFIEILKSFLIGMCAAVPLGPVAILVVQKTLSKGHKAGFLTGLGATTVDTTYSLLAVFALAIVQKFISEHEILILLLGGLILFVLGIRMATSNPFRRLKAQKEVSSKGLTMDYLQALLMGFSNPGAIFVIFALFAFFGIETSSHTDWSVMPIILGVASGSVTYWFLMSSLINHFRKKFKIGTLVWINRVAGAIITVIGIALLGDGLFRVVIQGAPII